MTLKALVLQQKPFRVHGLEDDRDIVEVVKEQARINGIPIEVFEVQQDLIKALNEEPDIVFLDWYIPGAIMTGNQLAALIRERLPECLIIMVTGHINYKDILYFYHDLKCYDWIEKKKDDVQTVTELIISIQRALELKRKKLEWDSDRVEMEEKISALQTSKSDRRNAAEAQRPD